MTCIVGLVHDNEVYMGCDSRVGIYDTDILPCNIEKIFWNDDFLIGVCGMARVGDVLRYCFEPPARFTPGSKSISIMRYLCSSFVGKMKKSMDDAGISSVEEDNVNYLPGDSCLLIGYEGKLYRISGGYSVTEIPDFFAIGSGADYALGSLETSKNLSIPPENRIKTALECACKYNSGCAGPFIIEKGKR
jgi:ATP-dependent protease HslVU (ClpYQ) peptidase subunit